MPGTQSIGFLTKLCAGDEDQFNVETVVTQMLQMISESMQDQPKLVRSPVLEGRPGQRQADQTTITLGGDVVTRMRYQHGNLLLKNWFGDYNSDDGQYIIQGTTEGNGMTLALDKRTSVWAFTGCKVSKIVIAATPETVTLTASMISSGLNKQSIINTPSVLAVFHDPSRNVLYHHMRLYVAPHSERDLVDVSNKIRAASFTITLERPLDQIFTNESQYQIEAEENNFRMVSINMLIPRYNSDQWHDWKRDSTRLQFAAIFEDPVTQEVFWRFIFPNVQIDQAKSNVGGPAAVNVDVTAFATESEDVVTSDQISALASDNSLNIATDVGDAATGVITTTGAGHDGETITIGNDVYELDTDSVSGGLIAENNIRLDLTGGTTEFAQGTLTVEAQPTPGDTFTIDTKTYVFDANGFLIQIDGHIEIGDTLSLTQEHIVNAINLTGTPGLGYSVNMTKHPSVTIADFASDDAVITAVKGGTVGNAIVTVEAFTDTDNEFDDDTLGTTTAGVNPTGAEVMTALTTAVNTVGTEEVAASGAAGARTITAAETGTHGNNVATLTDMLNATWAANHLTGGVGSDDVFPYCWPGADAYVRGFTTNGARFVAPVVERHPHKMVLASAANGGIDLVDEAASADIEIVTRTFDVAAYEN